MVAALNLGWWCESVYRSNVLDHMQVVVSHLVAAQGGHVGVYVADCRSCRDVSVEIVDQRVARDACIQLVSAARAWPCAVCALPVMVILVGTGRVRCISVLVNGHMHAYVLSCLYHKILHP